MGVQFPDLQVLLPRSVDAMRAEVASLQQQGHHQQGLAQEQVQRAERRLQQVRTKAEDPLRTNPDGGGRGGSSRRRRSQEDSGQERPAAAGPTGRYVDLRA